MPPRGRLKYWGLGDRGLASPVPLLGATQHVAGTVDGVRDGLFSVVMPTLKEIPQLQFSDMLFVPFVMRTLVETPQVQFSVQFVPVVTPTLVEIPQVQFSVQFVPVVTPTLVEIPQVQFLDQLFIPVVVMSGADGQSVLKTVEIPQMPFLSRCTCPLSLSGAMARQC